MNLNSQNKTNNLKPKIENEKLTPRTSARKSENKIYLHSERPRWFERKYKESLRQKTYAELEQLEKTKQLALKLEYQHTCLRNFTNSNQFFKSSLN